jgi:hypothetical protein
MQLQAPADAEAGAAQRPRRVRGEGGDDPRGGDARSFYDLIPAGNALPMDQTLAWSREDWERQEAAKQQRLLKEAALRWRVAPVVNLEESDDKWYLPSSSPARVGDPGQGTSRWGDPGQSSSQQVPATSPRFDDGGDYTVFYRHFSM